MAEVACADGEPIELLRKGGLANPRRAVALIRDTIAALELDLSGLTVLTEGASGAYVVTPIIAAMAGAARVIALTRDSRFATAAEVVRQTRALEQLAGVKERVDIHTARHLELFASADIVTNLGFVRPIDRNAISYMRAGTVVPIMCEAWEFRRGDVDLEACNTRGVHVLATNEDFPRVNVFAYSGWLCVKLLLDAGIELHKSRVLVVGSDRFGPVITRLLERSGVDVTLTPRLLPSLARASDAIVIADYTRQDEIIGEAGDIRPDDIHQLAPDVVVVQFAGRVDVTALRRCGIMVYPGQDLPSRRMAQTFAALGPRPVIELHAAGLKVGEIGIGIRTSSRGNRRFDGLVQHLPREFSADIDEHGK